MKKAVHLIVEKFDDIIQEKLNLLVTKKVKDEVDLRMIQLRSISRANQKA